MTDDNQDEDVIDASDRSVEEKIKDFSKLLEDIETLSDKKRRLWREIYENAISDRQNAYIMFGKLAKIMESKSTEHAVHGRTAATYIEKMQKSNEQLVKLAELIARAENKSESIDPEDMFKRINHGN